MTPFILSLVPVAFSLIAVLASLYAFLEARRSYRFWKSAEESMKEAREIRERMERGEAIEFDLEGNPI